MCPSAAESGPKTHGHCHKRKVEFALDFHVPVEVGVGRCAPGVVLLHLNLITYHHIRQPYWL